MKITRKTAVETVTYSYIQLHTTVSSTAHDKSIYLTL